MLNHCHPDLITAIQFSVNDAGIVFVSLSEPDLTIEFHPGDKYYEDILRWAKTHYALCEEYDKRWDELLALPESQATLERLAEEAKIEWEAGRCIEGGFGDD